MTLRLVPDPVAVYRSERAELRRLAEASARSMVAVVAKLRTVGRRSEADEVERMHDAWVRMMGKVVER